MDISRLTPLINALRAETEEDSITPESLGALLQKIVDVIGNAADNFTLQQVVAWQRIVQQCMAVITNIKQGDADRNDIYLVADTRNPSLGTEMQAFIPIKQATTERAGAMRAQQVTDLNWCRNRTQEIIPQLVTLTTDIATAQKTADRAEGTAIEGWNRMLALEYAQNTIKSQIADLQKAGQSGNSADTATAAANTIALESVNGNLHVRGDIQTLHAAGLVPYIFRYSVKQSRLRNNKEERRKKGPRRKGWHVFYGMGKTAMNTNSYISIRSDRKDGSEGRYYGDPKYLFDTPKRHVPEIGRPYYSVAFGKHNYDVQSKARKFRFGIALGIPTEAGRQFRMNQLRTNIAEVKVLVYYNKQDDEIQYVWSR